MTKLRAFLLMLSASAFAAGCTTTGSDTTGFRPIRPTAQDVEVISDSLARQILEHNAHGERVHGWRP